MSRKRCKSKNIRASTDEENQPSVWQDPKFVIGMAFLGTFIVVLVSIFIYKLIQRKKTKRLLQTDLLKKAENESLDDNLPALESIPQEEECCSELAAPPKSIPQEAELAAHPSEWLLFDEDVGLVQQSTGVPYPHSDLDQLFDVEYMVW